MATTGNLLKIFYEKECLLQLNVRIKVRTKQRVSFFIVLPSTAPLSHRKPALAQISCRNQATDQRNGLYLDERVEIRGLL